MFGAITPPLIDKNVNMFRYHDSIIVKIKHANKGLSIKNPAIQDLQLQQLYPIFVKDPFSMTSLSVFFLKM